MQDCIVRGSIPRSWDALPWTNVCVHAFTPLLATVLAGCAPGAPRYHEAQDALAQSSPPAAEAFEAETPFPGAAVLDRRALVEEVLRRNPSLESMRQAWRAALARYPQETALDDPRSSRVRRVAFAQSS